jgi:hypothetical protein
MEDPSSLFAIEGIKNRWFDREKRMIDASFRIISPYAVTEYYEHPGVNLGTKYVQHEL